MQLVPPEVFRYHPVVLIEQIGAGIAFTLYNAAGFDFQPPKSDTCTHVSLSSRIAFAPPAFSDPKTPKTEKNGKLFIPICKELFAKAGEQAESLYSPDADLTKLTEALRQASEKAKEKGTAYSTAFDYGIDAFGLYRSCAACDLLQIDTIHATGRLLDVPEVRHGFEDYIRKHLKMGVQYASSILLRRAAAVKDLGNRAPADGVNNDQTGYVEDFQIASFFDPVSGRPDMMQNLIARIIRRP